MPRRRHDRRCLAAQTTTPNARTDGRSPRRRPGDETVKVMEERLRVGKREVAGGAVRVRSYVVERPVEEQVRLRDERVSVDRRPVDRPATADEMALFKEHTIEARATSEEAVVSKEARVVEEIGIHKEANERTETVHDTVRKTEVEVDDQSKSGTSRSDTSTSGTPLRHGRRVDGHRRDGHQRHAGCDQQRDELAARQVPSLCSRAPLPSRRERVPAACRLNSPSIGDDWRASSLFSMETHGRDPIRSPAP